MINMLDNQILLLFETSLLAQVGTYRKGVAVTSQILCISITLNKKILQYGIFKSTLITLHPLFAAVKLFIDFPFPSTYTKFIIYSDSINNVQFYI